MIIMFSLVGMWGQGGVFVGWNKPLLREEDIEAMAQNLEIDLGAYQNMWGSRNGQKFIRKRVHECQKYIVY